MMHAVAARRLVVCAWTRLSKKAGIAKWPERGEAVSQSAAALGGGQGERVSVCMCVWIGIRWSGGCCCERKVRGWMGGWF